MTDRGLPIVDGAPACPFVAFEDDRDGRGLAPDHRHRCYAEPRPAPRALAHQEAYCLSSAFPVCPTFQDWARREAAAARPAPAEPESSAHEEAPVSQSLPPRELDARHPPGTDTPPPLPPRRNPPRDWAAPPPWSAEDEEPGPGNQHPPAEAPAFLATREAERAAEGAAWGAASRGLAGSAADRLAGQYADEPPEEPEPHPPYAPPSDRAAPSSDRPAPASGRAAPPDDRYAPPSDRYAPPSDRYAPPSDRYAPPADRSAPSSGAAGRAGAGPAPSSGRGGTAPASPSHGQPRREPQDPSELFGPAWERPHRFEAYPSLRTRVGLPGLGAPSSLGIAAIAVVLAAVVLFFVGPMLLGIGGNDGGGAPPSAVVEATATPLPTEPPAPTPQIYVVAKNDTISKIARKFGLTVDQLLAANKQIKNPDRISIGDEITIPVPESDASEDGLAEGASAAP